MKLIYIIKIVLLILIIQSCTPTKTIRFHSDRVQSFNNWEMDSIKSFLTDTWIRVGKFENNRIVEDTLDYYSTINDTIKVIKLVNPTGMYNSYLGKKEKQKTVPAILLEFYKGVARLHEDQCNLPDLSCSIGFHCFQHSSLIFKNDKLVYYYGGMGKSIKVKNPMHYINQDIILIEKKAYIRRGKWKEYAANTAYILCLVLG